MLDQTNIHAVADKNTTFCSTNIPNICTCGCDTTFPVTLEEIDCVHCLREMVRRGAEPLEWAEGYYAGANLSTHLIR